MKRTRLILCALLSLLLLASCASTTQEVPAETPPAQETAPAMEPDSAPVDAEPLDDADPVSGQLPETTAERINEALSLENPEPSSASDFPLISMTTSDHHIYHDKTRDSVLSAFGFQGETPYYTYYDEEQNLQLELFFDATSGMGCGFRYAGTSPEGTPVIFGFSFFSVPSGSGTDPWSSTDPYSVKSVYGDDGSESVYNYTETTTPGPNGKPAQFCSTGTRFSDPDSSEWFMLIQVEFTYRSDGSLLHKSYWHHPVIFGTTFDSSQLDYDEAERLVFARSYITHGHLEYYYIYDGDSAQPAYCLCLDNNLGTVYDSSLLQL